MADGPFLFCRRNALTLVFATPNSGTLHVGLN
jgi:hypothetical protein